MILVTGATGNVGNEVVHALAARATSRPGPGAGPGRAALPGRGRRRRRATSRRPTPSLPALDGVRKVFLLGGFADLRAACDGSASAGIEHVVLLTSRCVVGGQPDNAITGMWLDAEAAVRDSGVAWTILRPSGFHSNALRWLPQLRARRRRAGARGRTCPSRPSTPPTSPPWPPRRSPNPATRGTAPRSADPSR